MSVYALSRYRRLIWVLIMLGAGFVIGLVFANPINPSIINPSIFPSLPSQGTNIPPTGIKFILSTIHLAFAMGLHITYPMILYQFWLFITPGLTRRERRAVYLTLPLSTLLGYLVMISAIVTLPIFESAGISTAQVSTVSAELFLTKVYNGLEI